MPPFSPAQPLESVSAPVPPVRGEARAAAAPAEPKAEGTYWSHLLTTVVLMCGIIGVAYLMFAFKGLH